jgi:3-phosphoshikimate 1-carboxyvinyltransferase
MTSAANESMEMHVTGPVSGRVHPPGSKSITNRALVVAALAEGTSTLQGALDSEDTQWMMQGLERLGIPVQHDPATATMRVQGCGGKIPAERVELHVGNSGTTVRFLTALAALGRGRYRLDGVPRMRERPIEPLLEALRQLGGACVSEPGTGCPPVVVNARGLDGGSVAVAGDVSSQFLSGLLMTAPYARRDVVISVTGSLVSQPYVEMTLRVMADFGVRVRKDDSGNFVVPAQSRYRATDYTIEPDASAASYFFAAAAVTGGTVTVEGLTQESMQGDVAFVELLARMGCAVHYGPDDITLTGARLHGIEADMTDISDTVPTLAVAAAFAEGPTTITGAAHVRHKETDRIAAVATELAKLGARVDQRADGLVIHPPPDSLGRSDCICIDTYDDHRMAMSFAVAGLMVPGVIIRDPSCVAKTYPRFFEDLARLTA